LKGLGFNKKRPVQIQRIQLMGIWIVLISVFIAELLVYTWSRVQCMRVGYEISAEADKQSELTAVRKKLSIELERLKSPDRLARIAKERLNLSTPTPEQMITIR
jgi:hypothetical protein